MRIKDIMTTELVSVTPKTSYADAAKLMHAHGVSSLPVCDDSGAIVGVLSEKDLFRAMFPGYIEFSTTPAAFIDEESFEDRIDELRSVPVESFMEHKIHTIGKEEPIMKAGGLMLAKHIHRLPVIEDGKLVGMVSREDVFSAILKTHLGF
jgi:CBS domain-containing protein